jgi:hypothetical protein
MSPKDAWYMANQWINPRDLNHDPYIFDQSGYERQEAEDLFMKYTLRARRFVWQGNDPLILRDAICSARTTAASSSAVATAAAMSLAPGLAPARQPEIEEYVGSVKAVGDTEVIAEIRPLDDEDGWDVILPRESFDGEVYEQQEFKCTITRTGSHVDFDVKILDSNRLRELKDFDIDEDEWLQWASQIDV